MPFEANRKLGYAMWAAARCYVCDAAAHYRVGVRGFCRRHRALADAQLRAARLIQEVDRAATDRYLDECDKSLRGATAHAKANGRRRRGFK